MLKNSINIIFIILLSLISISSNAFASKDQKGDDGNYSYNYAALNGRCQVYDPYEAFNRKVFIFNGVLDTFILRPITKIYGHSTNDYTKQRVGSFVGNIEEPLTFVNYTMQGNKDKGFKSFWRFMINSTIGIGGLFDVASHFDVKAEPQTFGNTLGSYGVGAGPYILLPIFGGTNGRGVTDSLVTNSLFNPLKYPLHSSFKRVVTVSKTIHKRDEIMPFTDFVTNNSPDPYIAIRDAILQQQESKMNYPDGFRCPSVSQ